LANLIGNASRLTEKGGGYDQQSWNLARSSSVMVTDTGRGTTAESQQLLFHKFQQASSLPRVTPNSWTGLGLWHLKMIVENKGGTHKPGM